MSSDNWREQAASLKRCRLGYDNGDKRRVEHLVRLAADPAGSLSRVEEHQLATLLHRYRQQIARQGPIASEGTSALAQEASGTEGSLSWETAPPSTCSSPSKQEQD